MSYTKLDLDTLALTVWAEARGESELGQRAVIWVVRNRLAQPSWWSRQRGDGIPDDTLAAVCRDPYQFSCWNPADPQSKLLHDRDTLRRQDAQGIRELCWETLHESVDDDPTLGSDHYCTAAVVQYTRWARSRRPTVIIGNHCFYAIGPYG